MKNTKIKIIGTTKTRFVWIAAACIFQLLGTRAWSDDSNCVQPETQPNPLCVEVNPGQCNKWSSDIDPIWCPSSGGDATDAHCMHAIANAMLTLYSMPACYACINPCSCNSSDWVQDRPAFSDNVNADYLGDMCGS